MPTETTVSPTSIDLTDLPPAAVQAVTTLVGLLRPSAALTSPNQTDPAGWSARLRAWVASHPVRPVTMDDDRESVYAGCGE